MGEDTRTNEELLALYQETGSDIIKKELTLRYLYIVKSIAVQMRDVYLGFTQVEDIINEGVIVLMKALDKYDASKNARFETYVSRRIRGMIIDIARKQDWVPRTVRKSCRDIQDKMMELYSKNGVMPSAEETAREVGMPVEKLQEVMGKMNLFSILSLDMVMEESQEKQKISGILNPGSASQPEEQYLENEFRQILKDAVCSLKEKEQIVISLYYVEELNMKEIAAVMEVSEPRVSQIHANAIRKLKQAMQQEMDIKGKGESHVSGIL